FAFLDRLADGEVGTLEAKVGDGVGAQARGVDLRPKSPVARTVPVGALLRLRFFIPHVTAPLEARCIDGIARVGERASVGSPPNLRTPQGCARPRWCRLPGGACGVSWGAAAERRRRDRARRRGFRPRASGWRTLRQSYGRSIQRLS